MPGFYKPLTTEIKQKPVIVYPCIGVEKVLLRDVVNGLENHLQKLYSTNDQLLKNGEYHIVILWDEASDDKTAKSVHVMTDVWIFDKIDSWGSGPLVDVHIFRDLKLETEIGVSAGDGILMLGREEELRRTSTNIDEFLHGKRAQLPKDLQPTEEFHRL